jgi:hypothetical protein
VLLPVRAAPVVRLVRWGLLALLIPLALLVLPVRWILCLPWLPQGLPVPLVLPARWLRCRPSLR